MLTPDRIEQYHRDGQIISPTRLSAEITEELKTETESFFASQPGVDPDYAPDLIKANPGWLKYAALPEILDMVGDLIGDDIILWGSALFAKKPVGGKATPWHQDAHYWPIRPLETCTAWIAVDHATEQNGCLKVIPGSHRDRKLYSHDRDNSDQIVLNQAVSESAMPSEPARSVILEPGMFSIHDAFLIHGAEANNSGLRRAGITFRYMPATSHFDRELALRQTRELGVPDISQRQLHLLRGTDRSGKNDIHDGEQTH